MQDRLRHKAAVTADPEMHIRRLIRKMVNGLITMTAVGALLTLYHYGLLYARPKGWVPFVSALWVLGVLAAVAGTVIAIQYIRIALRNQARRVAYDRMIQSAVNQVLALEEDNHLMGAAEAPEPLRRRVERAVARVEARAGIWHGANSGGENSGGENSGGANASGLNVAGELIETLSKNGNAYPLVEFLLAQRPNTIDLVARNREIATISYLQSDFETSGSSVSAILLRLPHDQDAMTRQALICFRNGELERAKKTFKRVVNIAREKKSELDLAGAYCNLGMLHVMLSEFDDAAVRYSQAMKIYNQISREDGQADCLVNLGLIALPEKGKGRRMRNGIPQGDGNQQTAETS